MMGNGVKTIGHSAFDSCEKLKNINIGNSVTSIGTKAFYGCIDLEELIIPNSVKKIDRWAFYCCEKLSKIIFEKSNGWWYSEEEDAKSGFDISSEELIDPTNAAQILTTGYYNYYLKRK